MTDPPPVDLGHLVENILVDILRKTVADRNNWILWSDDFNNKPYSYAIPWNGMLSWRFNQANKYLEALANC